MSAIALPTRKSRYAPKELGEKHREIIRLYTLGMDIQDIAATMQCGRHSVRYIINSPLGIQMRQELQARRDEEVMSVSERLAQVAPKALKLMQDTMEGKEDGASLPLRIKICESFLDRAGYSKILKSQNTNINTALTADEILELQGRAVAEADAAGRLAQ